MSLSPGKRNALIFSSLSLTAFAIALWFYLLAFGGMNRFRTVDTAVALTNGGSPEAGFQNIQTFGCGGCHQIPGVPGAVGKVGPSLKSFKDQAMIAGVMKNSPDNLIIWLQVPRGVDPKTAMPELGVSEQQARDIAAYLYSLKH